ncbi:MAG: tetratricopeptide repeat protein [bacterium]|nr:tetratricopeptide repeat protein [bacterium]
MKTNHPLHVGLAILLVVLLFMPGLKVNAAAAASDAETDGKLLLSKAKLELFDRKWDSALEKLDRLAEQFPDSSFYPSVLFYKGKCLEELKKWDDALKCYSQFLKISVNRNLNEEATIAIIDLNSRLSQKGEKKYLRNIAAFLDNRKTTVRYYAAFKLSYAKNKTIASEAIHVLKKIVDNESDDELVDRAKLALMRIDPSHLKAVSQKKNIAKRMLHFSVYDKEAKKETVSFSFPLSLAKLALNALPEEEKTKLRDEGYNLDRILDSLMENPKLLRIEVETSIFKIWLE